jgi:hypothetical protein
MDWWDHPLDHLLPEECVVPIVVDDQELKIIDFYKKYKKYHIHISYHKFEWKKSHEVPQVVVVDMEVWTALEVPVKELTNLTLLSMYSMLACIRIYS